MVPYFRSLKNYCSSYLVASNDSKELAKLIYDLGKFHGVFTQKEIDEFAERRQNLIAVKREVERDMYVFGVKYWVIV